MSFRILWCVCTREYKIEFRPWFTKFRIYFQITSQKGLRFCMVQENQNAGASKKGIHTHSYCTGSLCCWEWSEAQWQEGSQDLTATTSLLLPGHPPVTFVTLLWPEALTKSPRATAAANENLPEIQGKQKIRAPCCSLFVAQNCAFC